MTCTYLQNIFTEIAILGFKKKVNVFWLHTYPLCVVSSLSDHCGGGGRDFRVCTVQRNMKKKEQASSNYLLSCEAVVH